MYIPEFLCGVFATLGVELIALIVFAVNAAYNSDINDNDGLSD